MIEPTLPPGLLGLDVGEPTVPNRKDRDIFETSNSEGFDLHIWTHPHPSQFNISIDRVSLSLEGEGDNSFIVVG
jgi:hypothetical protein